MFLEELLFQITSRLIAVYLLIMLVRYLMWISRPEVQQYLLLRINREDWLSFLFKDRAEEIVPPPSLEISKVRAEERRRAISEAIREYTHSVESLPYEFLETPPGYETLEPRSFTIRGGESYPAHAQMARLEWQLKADELLLAERVVDALIVIDNTRDNNSQDTYFSGTKQTGDPLVRLVMQSRHASNTQSLPWKVVIETDLPELYKDRLKNLSNWLGIGIDIARSKGEISLLGKCTVRGGMTGLMGGMLMSTKSRFGVTCAHVVSRNCKSLRVYRRPSYVLAEQEPDAAVISLEESYFVKAPCFQLPIKPSSCAAATSEQISDFVRYENRVQKRHPETDVGLGIIRSRVIEFSSGGTSYRGFYLEVVAYPKPPSPWKIWELPWGDTKLFSQTGDSGSWVFETASGAWIGMVTAGYSKYSPITYIAEAGPLLNYLERCLQSIENLSLPYKPYSWK